MEVHGLTAGEKGGPPLLCYHRPVPDWSYRTLLRPALMALGPARAQAVAVRTLSALGGSPLGLALIDFMGHMRVDPRLATAIGPVSTTGPVGLSGLIDPEGRAAPALSRFGFGFVEVGPVAHGERVEPPAYRIDRTAQALYAGARAGTIDPETCAVRLAEGEALRAACWVRLAAEEPASCARAVHAVRAHAGAFVVDVADADRVDAVVARLAAVVVGACREG
jgi:hypothetical protein